MRKGGAWFDLSTNSPTLMRLLHKIFAERGIEVLDAPVSGGEKGAESGTLGIMVGGTQHVFEKCLPIFQAMGKTITYTGPAGCGQKTKLVNQLVGATNLLGAVEGLRLAHAAGLDPQSSEELVRDREWMAARRSDAVRAPKRRLTRTVIGLCALGLIGAALWQQGHGESDPPDVREKLGLYGSVSGEGGTDGYSIDVASQPDVRLEPLDDQPGSPLQVWLKGANVPALLVPPALIPTVKGRWSERGMHVHGHVRSVLELEPAMRERYRARRECLADDAWAPCTDEQLGKTWVLVVDG